MVEEVTVYALQAARNTDVLPLQVRLAFVDGRQMRACVRNEMS